jgi:hypothetical protein
METDSCDIIPFSFAVHMRCCIHKSKLGFIFSIIVFFQNDNLYFDGLKFAEALTTSELKSYAKAGAIAEEVFTAIRTVFAFNGGPKEYKRYESQLDEAKIFGIKKSVANGFMMGFLWLVINCAYALGFW